MPTVEEAWNGVRHRFGRALGPRAARRTGWFYVVRRGVAVRVSRALEDRPSRAANVCVELDELPGRFPHVEMQLVEPPERLPPVAVGARVASERRIRDVSAPWMARAAKVLEMPGGVVFGQRGWVGVDESHLLVTGEMRPWSLSINGIRREADRHRRGRAVELLGRTAALLQPANGNYAHTLLQTLPRLDAMDRAVGIDQIDRFLVPERSHSFALELFGRWGIQADRLERVPERAAVHYRCETLVAGTWPESNRLGTRSVVDPIRRRFAPELAAARHAPPRRWYLTRSEHTRRSIENDDAVQAMLAGRGFEPLVMDGRTVAEQAALVAQAECVVGLHGAALANLVFAPAGTPVLELIPANVVVLMYARLAVAAGLRYDMLVGREACLPSALHLFLLDADMIVDVDDLAARVDAMLAA